MAIGDSVGEKAADELTNKALPEVIAALHDLMDRLEVMLARLDGATITIKLSPKT